MVKDSGCSCAIIGHSERRQYFNETDEILNKKTIAAQKNSIQVIFCIGESLQQRESGKTYDVLKSALEKGLQNVSAESLVVAYEPIWAIGTGKTATVQQAEDAHAFIRERLKVLYGNTADELRIIYGGSVTPENIESLMDCPNVDGALVGGASLKFESFIKIVKFKA
jgi:triosephosphate isomerase